MSDMDDNITPDHPDYWYLHRDELKSGMIFRDQYGYFVRLEESVPGDGTQWFVSDHSSHGWSYCYRRVEPCDLCGEALDAIPATNVT